jgi:hypothetical protein
MATNSQGDGEYSIANEDGVYVQTIPQAPSDAPIRVEAQSTISSITVDMPEVESNSVFAGGAEITSYNLQYNMGDGSSTFYEVIGESYEQLETVITITTTPGTTYLFRYRVKNVFGLSDDFSPEVEIKSAKAPNEPSSAATSIVGYDVKIEWVPSDDNYDAIIRLEIEILSKQDVWIQNTLTCDGADETIQTNNYCFVPLLTLLSTDFALEQGDIVNVRIAGTNTIGSSTYIEIAGVLVQTVALAPDAVLEGANTTEE